MAASCFFKEHGLGKIRCEGSLKAAHLISKRKLKNLGLERYIGDERTFIPACGGIMGNGGHHGDFDYYKIVIPWSLIPAGFLEFLREHDLGWYLHRDRRFGPAGSTGGRAQRLRGEQHGSCKFTDAVVSRIRELSAQGLTHLEVSNRTGVSPSYVCRIAKGDRRR